VRRSNGAGARSAWRDSTGSGFVPSGNFDWTRADRLLGQPAHAWN